MNLKKRNVCVNDEHVIMIESTDSMGVVYSDQNGKATGSGANVVAAASSWNISAYMSHNDLYANNYLPIYPNP